MRIFPRFHLPHLRKVVRAWQRLRRHLSVMRVVWLCEALLFIGAMAFALTGRARLGLIKGARTDALVIGALIFGFVVLHIVARRYLVPWIEHWFAPPVYDERRILFDLGQEARSATDLNQLYQSIISQIGATLHAEHIAVLVRDDAAGEFICRMQWPKAAESDALMTLPPDAFVVKRLRHLSAPLVIESSEYEQWERMLGGLSVTARAAREREIALLKQLTARLLLQIRIKDQLIGILVIGARHGGHSYSTADKEMLIAVAGQLAFVIENARLLERIVAEERLRRELELAAKVQQRLLPTVAPTSNAVELAGVCFPARGVGGDYYDFLPFDNDQIGIAVADVAGKGMSAALLMSTVQASLRSQVMSHDATAQNTLAGLVANMNLLLCRATGGANYVTFFYAQFDERTRQLTYVNAGHNPPFVLRPQQDGSDWLKLSTGGLFIGAFDHLEYEQETIALQSGDVLVAYTDGVTEAMNATDEEFGEDRLQAVLAEFAALSAEGLRAAVVERVRAWSAGTPQNDDLTFLVLKVR